VRGYLFRLSQGLGSRRSLSARGQFLNTFARIGFSEAFSLLALAGYLIEQQFANPVQADSPELLLAALRITAAVTLLYCLLHPFRRSRQHIPGWPAATDWEQEPF
jgi:hypothetical protein